MNTDSTKLGKSAEKNSLAHSLTRCTGFDAYDFYNTVDG